MIVSIPDIFNLLIIVLLIMLIFGIFGVNLFKGRSFYCDTGNIALGSMKEVETLVRTKHDCLSYGGSWVRHHFHFDNIGSSVWNMVVMTQTVNWW